MMAQQTQIEGFLNETPRAVSVLAGQRDRIAALMTQTTTLAKNLDAITAGRQAQLDNLVPDAAKLVDSLAAFNNGVGQTLANMNSFMTNFSRAIRGDYLVFDGALDIPGAAITALTQAGTDADKQAVINFNTDLLAGSTLYTHFRLAMTTAVADCDAGAIVLGFDPRYAPASDNDATTVDEIVTV